MKSAMLTSFGKSNTMSCMVSFICSHWESCDHQSTERVCQCFYDRLLLSRKCTIFRSLALNMFTCVGYTPHEPSLSTRSTSGYDCTHTGASISQLTFTHSRMSSSVITFASSLPSILLIVRSQHQVHKHNKRLLICANERPHLLDPQSIHCQPR